MNSKLVLLIAGLSIVIWLSSGYVRDHIASTIIDIPKKITNCELIQEPGWKEQCEMYHTGLNEGIPIFTVVLFIGIIARIKQWIK